MRRRVGARYAAAALCAALGSSMPATAAASEDRGLDAAADPHASARRLVLAGDFGAARKAVNELLASPEAPVADRAAAAELLFVVESWTAVGGRPRATRAASTPYDDRDWQRAFSAARGALVAGDYADAAARFERLAASAPDPVAAARAAELLALAREAVASASAPAHASPPPTAPSTPPARPASDTATTAKPGATESRWYGWQTLLGDAAAIGLTPVVPPVGIGVYALAAPIIHIVHERPLIAVASLGLRVVLPAAGAFMGYALAEGCSEFLCELEGASIGLLVGVGAAIVLDAAALAHESVPVKKSAGLRILPTPTGVAGVF